MRYVAAFDVVLDETDTAATMGIPVAELGRMREKGDGPHHFLRAGCVMYTRGSVLAYMLKMRDGETPNKTMWERMVEEVKRETSA